MLQEKRVVIIQSDVHNGGAEGTVLLKSLMFECLLWLQGQGWSGRQVSERTSGGATRPGAVSYGGARGMQCRKRGYGQKVQEGLHASE